MTNYEWLDLIPYGWQKCAKEMIDKCIAIDPSYRIIDLKEKWGEMRVYSECNTTKWEEIDKIERHYQDISATLCCNCGHQATKLSKPWILPWCDDCGIEEEKFYERF